MTSKSYDNISDAEFNQFLKLAFCNGMVATQQEPDENGKASGQLVGHGLTISYEFKEPNLQISLIKKSGFSYFLPDEKIFSIMDSYAGINK